MDCDYLILDFEVWGVDSHVVGAVTEEVSDVVGGSGDGSGSRGGGDSLGCGSGGRGDDDGGGGRHTDTPDHTAARVGGLTTSA